MTTPSVISLFDTTPHEADLIRVFLRDCRVDLRTGVYDQEKIGPQTVIINVEMEASLLHHYQDMHEAELDRVINYEIINDFIRKDLPKIGHIHLLETIADHIIAFCFKDIRVRKVSVCLEKPHVFSGSAGAGIEITRTRPAF